MPKFAIIIGVILTILGLYAYYGMRAESATALIPTFFGIPFIILGWLGQKEKYRKHTMHGAAVLALLGFFGTVGGLIRFVSMLGGTFFERPEAITVQAIMAILTLSFVIFAVKSFIDARTAQKKNGLKKSI